MRKNHKLMYRGLLLLAIFILLGPAFMLGREPHPGKIEDTDFSWQVAQGYELSEDATGFEGPVSIAFLNRPGPDPKSPLYFVTELRGKLKVVLRDRSVELLGKLPKAYLATAILPESSAGYGLHGVCIDSKDQNLYTTSVFQDDHTLVNRITHWKSRSEPAWETAHIVRELRHPFRGGRVVTGHSIGNCFVGQDGKLWVGVGAGSFRKVHDPTSSEGKLLRLNLDLSAPKDNPFYSASNSAPITNYIYAMGFRNPWAIGQTKDGSIYVADNGQAVDRLVRVSKGQDFPWDGTDASLTYDNMVLWPQSIGPAAMLTWAPPSLFPELDNALLITAPARSGMVRVKLKDKDTVLQVPDYIFRRPKPNYKAEALVGVAMGPDGIYVAHMVYDRVKFFKPSSILKILPNKDAESTILSSGKDLLNQKGCLGCHAIDGQGAEMAPALDDVAARISTRLRSREYWIKLESLDQHADPEVKAYGNLRGKLRNSKGTKQLEVWLEAKLKSPRFDNPSSQMPELSLNDREVKEIVRFLTKR